MSRASTLRVVVVGAGIVGASVAYHLSRRGVAVTVVERDEPACGATSKSFGWINASFDNPRPYYALRLQSLFEWNRLQSELGGAIELKWGGSLFWEQDECPALQQRIRTQQSWGYPVRGVDKAEFGSLEGSVREPPSLAAFAELEGTVPPVQATEALLAAARAEGARELYGCGVEALRVHGDRVCGVHTSAGDIETEVVVVAAGVDTPSLSSPVGVPTPLRQAPGLLVHTKPVAPLLNRVVLAPAVHMKQDPDGRVVAGEDFGGGHPTAATEALSRRVLASAKSALSHAQNLEIERVTLGYRPLPQDEMPVIGFSGAVSGLYVTVMHSGVTLAPIVGRLASEEIIDNARVDLLDAYRPARFE